MTSRRIATIGIYGFTAEGFLRALDDADVDVVVDVRQRRGVRGAEYAWANATRLARALDAAGIAYVHWKDAAPSPEIRQRQYAADAVLGVGKRQRSTLSEAFVEAYRREVLDQLDLSALLAELPSDRTPALLCVEREPQACHRSLLADALRVEAHAHITHLVP